MSTQHPGAGSRPVPGHDSGTPGAADPTPVTAPYAAAGGSPAAQSTEWRQAAPGAPEAEQRASGWGAPAAAAPKTSAGKPWTMKRGLAVAGATVVLAAGAGAGVYALTSSSAAGSATAAAGAAGGPGAGTQGFAPGMPGSQQGGPAGGGMSGQGGPNDFAAGGMGGLPGGLSAAVHAEYVVLDGSDYTTKAEQLGTVSDVSSSSVTVKSADGFTCSYALGSDVEVSNTPQRRPQSGTSGTELSVSDIVAGGTVRIVAAKVGSAYTAESVQVVPATATGQSN